MPSALLRTPLANEFLLHADRRVRVRLAARSTICRPACRPRDQRRAGVVVERGRIENLVGERGWRRNFWRSEYQRLHGAPLRRKTSGRNRNCKARGNAAFDGASAARTLARLRVEFRPRAHLRLLAICFARRLFGHPCAGDRSGRAGIELARAGGAAISRSRSSTRCVRARRRSSLRHGGGGNAVRPFRRPFRAGPCRRRRASPCGWQRQRRRGRHAGQY